MSFRLHHKSWVTPRAERGKILYENAVDHLVGLVEAFKGLDAGLE
jgi:creatinine amidohydrolase/Fe(II)-dependent formamide hydrolase-like protein